jgi:hypothetical protein
MRHRGSWWFGVFLLLTTGLAWAEGPGVKLGDRLVLHPSIGVEFRFDSNVFYSAENPTSAFLFRLMPSIDLATRPPQRGGDRPHMIDFRLHAGFDYNEWLTDNPTVNQYRMFNVQAGALLTILPNYPFSIDLFDNYSRTSQPPYNVGNARLDRDLNDLGVRFRYKPGGGRLEFLLSYIFGIDFWETPVLKDLNNYQHRLALRALWRFFPKTALFIEVNQTSILYPNPGALAHPDAYPIRAIAGLNGLLTRKITFNLYIGYGNGLYSTGPSPNTAIGGLDFSWRPTMLTTASLGYRHDFANSLLGSYYDLDYVYAGVEQAIWRFIGSVRLQYQNVRFGGITPVFALDRTDRVDHNVKLDVRFDYPIRDWLTVGIGYSLQYNDTNASLATGTPPPLGIVALDYLKNEVWLRAAVNY